MSILIRNGWEIYFHRQLFGEQRRQLREEVKKLKDTLSADEFVTHPKAKLLAAVMAGIKEKIVLDPFASHFALQGPLKHYGRIKRMGLPPRYRLFFRAFEEQNRRMLIVLWLGYPRKEEDKNDCYAVFTRKVNNGEIPDVLEGLLKEVES